MSDRFDENRLHGSLRASEAEAKPGPACPAPLLLLEAASGELDPGKTRAIVEHTVACGACSEAWRIAVEVARETGGARQRPQRATPRWIALAATVALAALVVYSLPERRAPAYRDSAAPPEIRAAVPDRAALTRNAFVLSWTPIHDALEYDLEVASEDLAPLLRLRGLTRTDHQVPAGALARVPDGGIVVWRVVARLPGGREVRSPAFLARVEGAAAP